MGIVVKKRKKKTINPVDHRGNAKKMMERVGKVLLAVSRNNESDRNVASSLANRARSTSEALQAVLDNDPALKSESPEFFAEIEGAISALDSVHSDLTAEIDSFPASPTYKREAFDEVISDGSTCLGNTDFVLPEGATMMVPNRNLGINDVRVVTDEHRSAGAKVRAIIGKYISEEE